MRFVRKLIIGIAFPAFCLLILYACWFHQNKEILPTSSETTEHWIRFRDDLLRSRELTAYYSFQDEHLRRGLLRNRKSVFPLTARDLKPLSSGDFKGRIVQGRWPEKQSIELDKTPILLPPKTVSGKQFALSAWIRHFGMGTVEGGNSGHAATIIALSDGVWTGWRLDLLLPSNRLVFQIARGKSQNPIGVVSSIRIPPKSWTYVTLSRESNRIRIFVNGLIAGEVLHNSEPTTLQATNCLKIGYAGNGLNSAIIQIDELWLFSDPPNFENILANGLQTTLIPFPHHLLEEASIAFVNRDYEKARTLYESLLQYVETDSSYWAIFRYRIGEINRLQKKLESAANIFKTLAQEQQIPTPIRSLALHDFLHLKESSFSSSDDIVLNFANNFFPDYNELAPASQKYADALVEFDFALPLSNTKSISLD